LSFTVGNSAARLWQLRSHFGEKIKQTLQG
jgi:hypothetical protein